jgi:hypothetical protein
MTSIMLGRAIKTGAAAIFALTLAACGEADSGSNTSIAQIDEQRAKWEATDIESYDFQYKVRCLCATKDRRLTIRGGRIERVDYKSTESDSRPEQGEVLKHRDRNGNYTDDDYYSDYGYYYDNDYVYTVDSLFRMLRDAHLDAHSVYVEYHPTFGYPTDMRIDWHHNWIDDEYQVLVVDFVLQ